MSDTIWDGITQESTLMPAGRAVRHALSNSAKTYAWDTVFEILEENPHFINATRLGGHSLYTPLHQAAHGGASISVVQRLVGCGAFRSLRNAKGERPVDIAKRIGHGEIARALAPDVHHEVQSTALRDLQDCFHGVIRERANQLVEEHSLRLPELEVLTELAEPRMWFAVPGMYGGFHFWLEVEEGGPVLISESWCRVSEGSGQRHEIRNGSAQLVDEGFV